METHWSNKEVGEIERLLNTIDVGMIGAYTVIGLVRSTYRMNLDIGRSLFNRSCERLTSLGREPSKLLVGIVYD